MAGVRHPPGCLFCWNQKDQARYRRSRQGQFMRAYEVSLDPFLRQIIELHSGYQHRIKQNDLASERDSPFKKETWNREGLYSISSGQFEQDCVQCPFFFLPHMTHPIKAVCFPLAAIFLQGPQASFESITYHPATLKFLLAKQIQRAAHMEIAFLTFTQY